MRVGAEIKQLPVSAAEKQGAFVQIRRKAPVSSFQPNFVRQKRIFVQISGAVDDGVDEGFRRIFEGDLGAWRYNPFLGGGLFQTFCSSLLFINSSFFRVKIEMISNKFIKCREKTFKSESSNVGYWTKASAWIWISPSIPVTRGRSSIWAGQARFIGRVRQEMMTLLAPNLTHWSATSSAERPAPMTNILLPLKLLRTSQFARVKSSAGKCLYSRKRRNTPFLL